MRYSDFTLKFCAQVPRYINDKLEACHEDVLVTTMNRDIKVVRIQPQRVKRIKIMLTHNTTFKSGDRLKLAPYCKFVEVLDRDIKVDYDSSVKRLMTSITIRNNSSKIVFCIDNYHRFAKISSAYWYQSFNLLKINEKIIRNRQQKLDHNFIPLFNGWSQQNECLFS